MACSLLGCSCGQRAGALVNLRMVMNRVRVKGPPARNSAACFTPRAAVCKSYSSRPAATADGRCSRSFLLFQLVHLIAPCRWGNFLSSLTFFLQNPRQGAESGASCKCQLTEQTVSTSITASKANIIVTVLYSFHIRKAL